jgi:two-component system response regulator PilR (NtrC family)
LALRDAGFEVVEAPDGNTLLEHLARAVRPDGSVERFDLILSDIRMPNFTALDVMVGARGFIGHTPFVLITAFGDAATHERALRLGAAAVLDKPIRLDKLCRTVSAILADKRGGAGLEKTPETS